jgi:hypothetical protein
VSLLYSDMDAEARAQAAACIPGFAEDNRDVELAYVELWEIVAGQSEAEWRRLGESARLSRLVTVSAGLSSYFWRLAAGI